MPRGETGQQLPLSPIFEHSCDTNAYRWQQEEEHGMPAGVHPLFWLGVALVSEIPEEEQLVLPFE
jgi:hypothetical protein